MYDFIVIGAGYGGLTAASLLAKSNKKVLVLESHYSIGGCAGWSVSLSLEKTKCLK